MYENLGFDQFQGAFLRTCFLAQGLALFQQFVNDAGSVDGMKQDLKVAQSAKVDSATVALQLQLELPVDCNADMETFPASPLDRDVMSKARGVMQRNPLVQQFCNFDMFRNVVKNSNSMCDVALTM